MVFWPTAFLIAALAGAGIWSMVVAFSSLSSARAVYEATPTNASAIKTLIIHLVFIESSWLELYKQHDTPVLNAITSFSVPPSVDATWLREMGHVEKVDFLLFRVEWIGGGENSLARLIVRGLLP